MLSGALKLDLHIEVAREGSGDAVNVRSLIGGVVAVGAARGGPDPSGGSRWTWRVILFLTCGGIVVAASVLASLLAVGEFHHVYFNRDNLPDLGPFRRFAFATI